MQGSMVVGFIVDEILTHRTTGAFDDILLTLMTDELFWFIQ